MRTFLFLASLMAGGTVAGQQASYTYINQPPPYANHEHLFALNTPKIGTTFQVQIPRSFSLSYGSGYGSGYGYGSGPSITSTAHYFLLTGVSNPQANLGPLGIPGFLFSSGEMVIPSSYFSGYGGFAHTVSMPIPMAPSLIGVGFYQQVVAVTTTTTTPCFAMCTTVVGSVSRGGHGVIGT